MVMVTVTVMAMVTVTVTDTVTVTVSPLVGRTGADCTHHCDLTCNLNCNHDPNCNPNPNPQCNCNHNCNFNLNPKPDRTTLSCRSASKKVRVNVMKMRCILLIYWDYYKSDHRSTGTIIT